jgi:hypothetical protein
MGEDEVAAGEGQEPQSGSNKAKRTTLGCIAEPIALCIPCWRSRARRNMRPGKVYCVTGIPLITIALVQAAAAVVFMARACFFPG